MPFCEHCGAQVSEASRFCRSCGAEQNSVRNAPLDEQILFHSDYTYEALKKLIISASIMLIGIALIWIIFEMMPYLDISFSYSELMERRTIGKLFPIIFIVVLILDLLDIVPKLIAVKSNFITITNTRIRGAGCVGIGITVSENFDLTFDKIERVESKGKLLSIRAKNKTYFCYIQKPVKAKKILSRYINDLAYE